MDCDVRLEHLAAAAPTAVVRRRAAARELSKVVPEGCGVVWKAVRAAGLTGLGRNLALYLDGEINLEVGVEVAAPFAGAGEVVGSSLPTGPVATVTHYGPYPLLYRAHEALRVWCDQKGHGLAGPTWELYGHWQEAWNTDPSQIRTDIYYLLNPGSAAA